jgi:acetate kinase
MDILAMVSQIPLFAGFSPQELEHIVGRSEAKSYRPGERIIHAGEPGSFLGVPLEGIAQAESRGPDGERSVLGEIPVGQYFGEIALVSGGPATADVVAGTHCTVLQIPYRVMSEALSVHPQAMRDMAKTITDRLVRTAGTQPRPRAAVAHRREPEVRAASTRLLIVDCGDASLAYQYYHTDNEMSNVWGVVEGIGSSAARHVSCALRLEETLPAGPTLADAAQSVIERLTSGPSAPLKTIGELTAVGHRVRHGGETYSQATLVDGSLVGDIASVTEFVCPENGSCLAGMEAFRRLLPGTPQVAVFDTAFFATMQPRAFLYGVPYEWYEQQGVRRYGRSGLAHQQAALLASAHLQQPLDALNLITCHIERAPSVCAIRHGRAIDVTGGFSGLEGPPGAATCGDIDAGLMGQATALCGGDPREVVRALTERGGLLGISGTSGGFADLLRAAGNGDERAELALDVFCYRLGKEFAAYSALLGETDAVVFTGAAGTTLPALRARTCSSLDGIGLELDDELNRAPSPDARGVSDVSLPHSSARILIAPTDESRMAASLTAEAIGRGEVSHAILAKRRPIPIGISAHHVHLSQAHVEALFGPGRELTFKLPLTQPGQFACEETVDLVSSKGRVSRVRVLGPARNATQVEISRTECFSLGIQAPIRMSGDLSATPGIRIEGSAGAVEIEEGVICARRHLHASPEEALMLGLRDKDEVSIRVTGERPVVFGDVAVRVHPEYRLDVHVDTDEANAARLDRGAVGYVENVDVRS